MLLSLRSGWVSEDKEGRWAKEMNGSVRSLRRILRIRTVWIEERKGWGPDRRAGRRGRCSRWGMAISVVMVVLLSMLLNTLVAIRCRSSALPCQKQDSVPTLRKMAKIYIRCQFSKHERGQPLASHQLANNKQDALDQLQASHTEHKTNSNESNQLRTLNMV